MTTPRPWSDGATANARPLAEAGWRQQVDCRRRPLFDGTGYPHRLKGEQISLIARMTAICDVYDA